MLDNGGRLSVKVTEVKGHATDALVARGGVRAQDLCGDAAADTAADLVRLRQLERGIGARKTVLHLRMQRCPIMLRLHRFPVSCTEVVARDHA